MDIIQFLWLLILFLLSLIAYLGFSVISHEALAAYTTPPEEKKEEYQLSPLTRLYPEPQGLLAALQFTRLLFALPLLVIAYRWGVEAGFAAGVLAVAILIPVLYLAPAWMVSKRTSGAFRAIVQVLTYILYPLFWLMAKPLPAMTARHAAKESQEVKVQPEEEESKEFKGGILRAISMIEETTVREVMTPRVDMICIQADATLGELHQQFKEHKFSRLPVYRDKIDNMVGLVSVMDFVDSLPNYDLSASVSDIMRPVLFVPESKKVFTLLGEFRESHSQMAVVIDEYGGISGLVTFEDLLEEIVGEIEDEYDEGQLEMTQDKDGTYIVTGKLPVERLEETFHIKIDQDDFETVSGLVFSVLGRIPLVGEVVKYQNLHLEILEADKRRIHRLRIKDLPQEKEDAEEVV